MFEYTFENHYKFSWGEKDCLYPHLANDYQIYKAQIGKIKDPSITWKDACYQAAHDMWTKCNDPYVMVCYSGGIDSEVALRSFLEQKIPVRAAIMKMKYDLNFHDYKLAIKFCERNNVKYHLFEVDAMEFLHNDMWNYADLHKMISPQIPFQLWLLDQFDEFPIVCGGDLPLYVEDKQINFKFKPQTTTVSRHLIMNNREGGTLFQIHNPEQVYSFLNDEIVKLWRKQFISSPIDNVYTLKPLIYEKYFPNLTPRWKWTGVEMFSPLDKKKLRPEMEAKYIKYNTSLTITVDELERMTL